MTARSVAVSSRLPMCTSHTIRQRRTGHGVHCRSCACPADMTRAMAIETTPSAAELRTQLTDQGVEFVFAQFVDMHGKPNAKLVPVEHLEGLFEDGAGFAGFAAGDIGQGPHDPDIAAMPDPRSLTPLPWKPEIARFACDVTVEGEPWPYCPRTILRNQLERAKALGFDFKIGCELEYFLVRRRPDGGIELADELDTLDQPCYDMRALTRSLPFVTDIARHVNALGWGLYATDHEDANGQFEQNFTYDDALVTCDRAVFFRYMVESIAQERGMLATFMPKPFAQPHRQRLPLPHEPVGGRPQRDGRRSGLRPARAGPEQAGLPLHRGPDGAREGLHRGHGADGQLLQAPEGRRPALRRDLGARVRLLRVQQPHADAARAGAGARGGPHGGRLLQPVPRGDRAAGRGPRRDRARARVPRPQPDEPVRVDAGAARRARDRRRCRPTCSTRRASSRPTT